MTSKHYNVLLIKSDRKSYCYQQENKINSKYILLHECEGIIQKQCCTSKRIKNHGNAGGEQWE